MYVKEYWKKGKYKKSFRQTKTNHTYTVMFHTYKCTMYKPNTNTNKTSHTIIPTSDTSDEIT